MEWPERYIIVRKQTLELLELRIKERMEEDQRYVPTGAPFWADDRWCQAIYLES